MPRAAIIVGAGIVLLLTLGHWYPAAARPVECDAVAAPYGADAAAGTAAAPFATAQRLADSLGPGETGCLRAGTYDGGVTISHGGRSRRRRVTLTSYPRERATVAGKLWVKDSADFVKVTRLNLDGRNPGQIPSPEINGDHVTLAHSDVTNYHSGICVTLGPTTYGRAWHTRIIGNAIHDCGRLPPTNHDHGIYAEHSTRASIIGNRIYNNADRGVQLYPDAQRTRVIRNWIDSNGEGLLFAGEDGLSSSHNVVRGNVISNSRVRNNVESYYPSGTPVGVGNVLKHNAIFGGAWDSGNGGIGPQIGFAALHNDTSAADGITVSAP